MTSGSWTNDSMDVVTYMILFSWSHHNASGLTTTSIFTTDHTRSVVLHQFVIICTTYSESLSYCSKIWTLTWIWPLYFFFFLHMDRLRLLVVLEALGVRVLVKEFSLLIPRGVRSSSLLKPRDKRSSYLSWRSLFSCWALKINLTLLPRCS